MQITFLDVIEKTGSNGRVYGLSACRAVSKKGNVFFFLAECPLTYCAGDTVDVRVCFDKMGKGYILE